MISKQELIGCLDATLLKPTATFQEFETFVDAHKDKGFYSLCLPPFFIKNARELTDCRLSTVIGFPNGTSSIDTKAFEIQAAIADGADCVDAVLTIGAIKSDAYDYIDRELSVLRKISAGRELRIIIETCYLTDTEKIMVTELIVKHKCDVVKTSTGFGTGNATIEDVKLLKSVTGNTVKIKASGGIKTLGTVIKMVNAGADLIGTSAALSILDELRG